MNAENRTLLEAARLAARQAAEIVLKVYATPFDVRHKSDKSPVTLADEQAERLIVAILKKTAPGIPVIAEEEQAAIEGLSAAVPPRFWLVDPLDGTKGFVARHDEFTVNIGLVEGHRPVLGVVGVPIKNLIYAASGPGTATRQRGESAPEPISARLPPAKPVVLSSRLSGKSQRIGAYLETLPAGTELRQMGSAVKFCLLAEGSADYYPRYGETHEWDTAAGQAILEAAGGSVTTIDGAPFLYGKPNYLNPGFIARGKT